MQTVKDIEKAKNNLSTIPVENFYLEKRNTCFHGILMLGSICRKEFAKRFRPNLGLFVTLWLPEEAGKGAWAIAIYGQCDSSMALNVATWGCNDNLNVQARTLAS